MKTGSLFWHLDFSIFLGDVGSIYMYHLLMLHNKISVYLCLTLGLVFTFMFLVCKDWVQMISFSPSVFPLWIKFYIFIKKEITIFWYIILVWFTNIIHFILSYKNKKRNNNSLIYNICKRLAQCLISCYYYLFGFKKPQEFSDLDSNLYYLVAWVDILRKIKSYDNNQDLDFIFLDLDYVNYNYSHLIDYINIGEYIERRFVSDMLDTYGSYHYFYWGKLKIKQKDIVRNNNNYDLLNNLNFKAFLDFFTSNSNIPVFYKDNHKSSESREYLRLGRFRGKAIQEALLAIAPTLIISDIIRPSVILIRGTDASVFSCPIVVKVIGAQWYWDYELMVF